MEYDPFNNVMWKYYKLQHLKSLKFNTKYNAVVTTIFTCIVILQGFSYPAIEFQKRFLKKAIALNIFRNIKTYHLNFCETQIFFFYQDLNHKALDF